MELVTKSHTTIPTVFTPVTSACCGHITLLLFTEGWVRPISNYSSVKVFNNNWIAEDILTNLRVGNYREHFKGYRELYSTPLLDLNKEGEIGFDIRTISKFIQKMLMDFDSKNFELELSRKLPEGHPYNKPRYNLYYNKDYNNSDKYGFYINNLMLGDLKVIVNGCPQNIKEYFKK